MIVVIGAHREGEERKESLLGVFPTLAEAKAAVQLAREHRVREDQQWCTWDRRREAILASFTPAHIYKGEGYPSGEYKSYTPEDYRRAGQMAGLCPPGGLLAETVYFYKVEVGEFYNQGADRI